MSVDDRNHNGFAARWETTAELAREFGFPIREVQRRVQSGELVPTWRTPGGKARWTRADFASQTDPRRAGVPIPRPQPHPDDGTTHWYGHTHVIAQPGRSIEVRFGGRELQLDPESARQLGLVLPAAAYVADAPDPGCECRELMRAGHVEMIVPVPTCPIHQGATP